MITVYLSNPPKANEEHVVKCFTEAGYIPLVDSIHKGNLVWFKTNFAEGVPRRFYSFDFERGLGGGGLDPDFSVHYSPEVKILATEWQSISAYINFIILGDTKARFTPGDQIRIEKYLPKPCLSEPVVASEPIPIPGASEEDEGYDFNCMYFAERDTKLYQVNTGHSDLPYTVVVRDFKNRGDVPFFTGLFACESWNNPYTLEHTHAIGFLRQLWMHLEMEGAFDLEALLKEATEACYPKPGYVPVAEPEVYRRTIDEVLAQFRERECSHGRELDDDYDEEESEAKRKKEE